MTYNIRLHLNFLFQVFFNDVMPPVSQSSLPAPARGIATDIATLDSAYFLSQVVLSCIMGYIVYMTGSVLSYMVTAGVMGILSIYFIQNVVTCEQEMIERKPDLTGRNQPNGVL
jgi:solute carrier family 45 protein 3